MVKWIVYHGLDAYPNRKVRGRALVEFEGSHFKSAKLVPFAARQLDRH